MHTYTLTKTRFRDGLWEGLVVADTDAAPMPEIDVSLQNTSISGVTLAKVAEKGRWVLEIPVPAEALGDGVHTFLIRDRRTDKVLDSFTLIAGDALDDDVRAEVALLRAELDMLKRAFRRHCLETM